MTEFLIRSYGRRRGRKLRDAQQSRLEELLPKLTIAPEQIAQLPKPLALEIGFGGGEHLTAMAALNPSWCFVGAEPFVNGVVSILGQIEAQGLTNIKLFGEDARLLLPALPDGTLQALYLLFADPWPKARHVQRRFLQPEMVEVLLAKLTKGGEWRIASDDPGLIAWYEEVLAPLSANPLITLNKFTTRPDGWPPTRYEQKALKAGRQPVYWLVSK